MKKIILFLLYTIIIIPCSFGMKRKANTIEPIFMYLPNEFKKHILLDLSQNVHRYAYNPCGASRIIVTISRVNKYFYHELEKERTDPITTREIIYKLKKVCHPCFTESFLLRNLKTLGAKKCIDLSYQLYNYHQDENNIETLINQGALLNYNNKKAIYIVQYAALGKCFQSSNYLKKLLALGANPNVKTKDECTALGIAIRQRDLNKITIILQHNPRDKYWETAFNIADENIIQLIIDHSTPNDLTQGLTLCAKRDLQDFMERFIGKGASIEQTLVQLLKEKFDKLVYYDSRTYNDNEPFVESINYLLNHKKIDTDFATQFKEKHALYERCKKTRKKNEQYRIKNRNQIESSIRKYARRK